MNLRATIQQELDLVKHEIREATMRDLCQQLDISFVTLTKYLNNKGSKIELYEKIINHLKTENHEPSVHEAPGTESL